MGLALLSIVVAVLLRSNARADGEAADIRQRSEAVRLAARDVERLRTFAALDGDGSQPGFLDITTQTVTHPGADAEYVVRREVTDESGGRLKAVAVKVHWTDRAGASRDVALNSIIDGTLPLHSAVLALPHAPGAIVRPKGRHADIPRDARDLGDGRSVWSGSRSPGPAGSGDEASPASPPQPPSEGAGVHVIIDNLTGEVIGRCAAAPPGPSAAPRAAVHTPGVATAAPPAGAPVPDGHARGSSARRSQANPADSGLPRGCVAFRGSWLSGHVMASWDAPPTAIDPPDELPSLSLQLSLDGQGEPAACAERPGEEAEGRGRPSATDGGGRGRAERWASMANAAGGASLIRSASGGAGSTPHAVAPPHGPGQPAMPGMSPADAKGGGATAEAPRAPPYLAYTCLVPAPSSGRGWSGRADIVPQGWTVGVTPSSRRVCRYTADMDGSGRIDRNEEHPARYHQVEALHLAQQNFLLVRGDQRCPSHPRAPHNGGLPVDTVPHQP